MPVNIILSTTIDILYKCIVSAGLTYTNDHSFDLIHLITFNKCKLQFEEKHPKILIKESIDIILVSRTLAQISSVIFQMFI